MEKSKKTLIVVTGPTAAGKTAVAIKLAQLFKTEIISADSRQIFKELAIGTAKPSTQELALVRHHFIDSHSIQDDYDAAQYGRDALALITELFKQHDNLILCGGSGLYIKAVCEGFDDIPEIAESIRADLMRSYELHGIEWLQQKMQELDTEHFHTIDKKNPHRLIRALEVRLGTGSSIASFRTKKKMEHPFTIVKIGLEVPREDLYQRIDKRMDTMIEQGLFEEAQSLYPNRNLQALQTVGYQEVFDFIAGKYNKDEAIRLLKRNTRRYAKRQLTWFKRDDEITWFAPENFENIVELIRSEISQSDPKTSL
ncbi:tRNA (adenosine(37)-N6)-dimethylallyltransferase MiaA [Chryseolinea sp. H1M3-3]|uniref:tRNA (adenosine(37)-N6)-dimethylallyltransferase MiaA n=1 Tax=Chryseolinea sp. H1M3-3 TaxID=3034144 RepID=UPI0023EB439D|nr:tRNA (adenosine(37)-N6)-dimethylallyltransferase MiaA [Chryseolinea sp. H1M3-3]